jgi:hypothetical protein
MSDEIDLLRLAYQDMRRRFNDLLIRDGAVPTIKDGEVIDIAVTSSGWVTPLWSFCDAQPLNDQTDQSQGQQQGSHDPAGGPH